MTKEPLISIIIPVYNREKYLKKCLDSVINQTYSNLDIICVNDGSTDSSLNILNEYAEIDQRVRIIDKENKGLSETRNVGIDNARGTYLTFIDSDDWYDNNIMEKCSDCINIYNPDVILYSSISEYSSQSEVRDLFKSDKVFIGGNLNKLRRRIIALEGEELRCPHKLDYFASVCYKLYKTDLVRNIRFVDLKLIAASEDTLFNIQALNKASKANYISGIYYHYRKFRKDQLTSTFKPNLWERFNYLYQLMETIPGVDRNLLNNRISLNLISLGLNKFNDSSGTLDWIYNIKQILNSSVYKNAIKVLPLKYFPFHWKLFFFCAKHKNVLLLWILFKIMRLIR